MQWSIIDLSDAAGVAGARIECPPVPLGYEGDYGLFSSTTRTFFHARTKYVVYYEEWSEYDKTNGPMNPNIVEMFSYIYPASSPYENANPACLVVALATSSTGFSPEELVGFKEIFDSWR
jgi:hypothetical protein